MNIAVILAAGVGQRMRNGGLPKQFLKLMGKPIVIYTLEKFEESDAIDKIIVVSHASYIDYMNALIKLYRLQKVVKIVVGGNDRQSSLQRGLATAIECGAKDDDIVVIHDGVRPLVSQTTIAENVRIASEYGCAMTVHPVTETVVITNNAKASIDDFKKRDDTYSLTAPQSFKIKNIMEIYQKSEIHEHEGVPLLDAAMVYANAGGEVHLVEDPSTNIKITTPEDFYYLKAILDLEESKGIFGL